MSVKSGILFVLAALVVLACAPAQATIGVTVRPDGDQVANTWRGFGQQCTNGWRIDTYNYGWGALCPWGGSTFNTDQVYSGRHFPGGYGAYYASCDFFQGTMTTDKNPSTAWLGTDTWNGTSLVGKKLGDIDEMSYWSFTERVPQRWGGGTPAEVEWWNKNGWWGYVQQPIVLELTAEALNPNTSEVEKRQFWYRPDGGNYVGDDGPKMKGQWYQWNCLTWGKWYSPQYDSSARGWEFGYTSWDGLMNASVASALPGAAYASTVLFKDWTLVDPANIWKSSGWKAGAGSNSPTGHPNATGTGKPVNFRVGARVQNPGVMYLNGVSSMWPNESYGFRGQVDGFVLGFNGTSVAFDFEPAGNDVIRTSAYAQKAAGDNIVEGKAIDRFTMNTAKRSNLFRISGKVTRSNTGTWDNSKRIWQNGYFVVEDGSGLTYQERWNDPGTGNWVTETRSGQMFVYLSPRNDGLDIWNGDYVGVTGFVEKLRFTESETPFCVWSTPSHVANYTYP